MNARDACRQLTVRRSQRMALSTIDASRVTARPAKLALDLTEGSRTARAVTGGTSGASANSVTDPDNSGPSGTDHRNRTTLNMRNR